MDGRYGDEVNMDYDLEKVINMILADSCSDVFDNREHGIRYWIDCCAKGHEYEMFEKDMDPPLAFENSEGYISFREDTIGSSCSSVLDGNRSVAWEEVFDPSIQVVVIAEEDLIAIKEVLTTHLDAINL